MVQSLISQNPYSPSRLAHTEPVEGDGRIRVTESEEPSQSIARRVVQRFKDVARAIKHAIFGANKTSWEIYDMPTLRHHEHVTLRDKMNAAIKEMNLKPDASRIHMVDYSYLNLLQAHLTPMPKEVVEGYIFQPNHLSNNDLRALFYLAFQTEYNFAVPYLIKNILVEHKNDSAVQGAYSAALAASQKIYGSRFTLPEFPTPLSKKLTK